MATVDEILKESAFDEWSEQEQQALSTMMHNLASHKSHEDVANRTERVTTTFIKILDRHLPENGGQ